jgi:hypothetical protein
MHPMNSGDARHPDREPKWLPAICGTLVLTLVLEKLEPAGSEILLKGPVVISSARFGLVNAESVPPKGLLDPSGNAHRFEQTHGNCKTILWLTGLLWGETGSSFTREICLQFVVLEGRSGSRKDRGENEAVVVSQPRASVSRRRKSTSWLTRRRLSSSINAVEPQVSIDQARRADVF